MKYLERVLKNSTTLRAATAPGETDAGHRRFSMPRLSDGRAIVVWAKTEAEADAIYRHWLGKHGVPYPASTH